MVVRVQMKSNDVVVSSNGVFHEKVYVSPKIAEESFEEKDYEVKECTEENSIGEKYHGEQDTLVVKSTSFDETPPIQKFTDLKQTSPPASKSPGVGSVRRNCTVPQPFALATQKRGTCARTIGFQSAASENVNSPYAMKNSQVVKLF